jgi:hypothetical protein
MKKWWLQNVKRRGFVLTLEALAALLVMLAALMLMLAHPAAGERRASQLAMQMQTEDVTEFIAREGGAEKVGAGQMVAIADALGACIRISKGGEELFRSACFGEGDKERAAAKYFEIDGTVFSSALLELERK